MTNSIIFTSINCSINRCQGKKISLRIEMVRMRISFMITSSIDVAPSAILEQHFHCWNILIQQADCVDFSKNIHVIIVDRLLIFLTIIFVYFKYRDLTRSANGLVCQFVIKNIVLTDSLILRHNSTTMRTPNFAFYFSVFIYSLCIKDKISSTVWAQ